MDTLVLDFSSPELRANPFLWLEPSTWWCFRAAALANECVLYARGALRENVTFLEKELEARFKELAIPCHINGAVTFSDLDVSHL